MAIETAIITAETPTSTGTQTYNVAGFGTPQAAIVTIINPNSGSNPEATVQMGMGFTDGTNHWSHCFVSQDAAGTHEARRTSSQSNLVIAHTPGSSTTDLVGVFSAWSANGITINYTTADSVAHTIIITLIKGCTNIIVGSQAISTTGVNDITSVGFKPNLVFFTSANQNTLGSTTYAIPTFGAAHNNSSDVVTQGSIHIYDVYGSAANNSTIYASNAEVVTSAFNGGYDGGLAATAFDASGFSLDSGAYNPGGRYTGWLAMDTGDTDAVDVSVVTTPTSTGIWSITDPGFTPQHVTLFGSSAPTINTAHQADPIGLMVSQFDETAAYAAGFDEDSGAAVMDTQANFSANPVQMYEVTTGHTLMLEGSLDSITASGYDINMTTVDSVARQFISVAIGGGTVTGHNATEGRGRLRSFLNRSGQAAAGGGPDNRNVRRTPYHYIRRDE